jgi:hypothetical protein
MYLFLGACFLLNAGFGAAGIVLTLCLLGKENIRKLPEPKEL